MIMKTKTIRTYIPVDVTIPEEHIEMVMSKEWQDSFYEFADEKEFVMYAARLLLFNFVDSSLFIKDLTGFDGHCVEEHKGHFNVRIPDDGWDTCEVQDWAEN